MTETIFRVSTDVKQKTFKDTLDALDSEESVGVVDGEGDQKAGNVLCLVVEVINCDCRRVLGDPVGGVVFGEFESDDAWRVGLSPGDVILLINNQVIEDLDGFEALVEDIEADRAVALRVWRNGTASFIAYTPRDNDEG